MKRILFFETPEFTGATRVTRTIAKMLHHSYEVTFASVNPTSVELNNEIKKAIDFNRPDILFSSFVSINPEVIEIGCSQRLFLIVRTDYKLSDISGERRQRIEETYPMADYLVAQTVEMRDELVGIIGVRKEQVHVFENPLDKDDIIQKASMPNPFKENGVFHFLWVGRDDPIKDIPTLQRAFIIVKQKFPKIDLTLLSNDDNPYRWIKNADCVVISSKSEASPNVLNEALYLGTPVVSTDCSPSIRRFLSERRIARVGDCNDLAEKMVFIIQDSFIIN